MKFSTCEVEGADIYPLPLVLQKGLLAAFFMRYSVQVYKNCVRLLDR